MKQFPLVDCSRGAPMGRREYGEVSNLAPRSVRLFTVNIDRGGYDDGGAYWGLGQPIYCALDKEGTYRAFVRAWTRAEAARALRIPDHALIVRGNQ